MKFLKSITKKDLFTKIIPASCIAVLIIVFAIINKQPFYKTLPTLVTLVVQILLVSTNRYAFLLGSLNCIFYGICYIVDGVYFSAISTFFMSMPLQVVSFFTWKKHNQEKNSLSTKFRRLTADQWILNVAFMIVAFIFCYFCLSPVFKNATSPMIDVSCFVIGIFATVWSMLRYIESQYINIISCILSIALFITVTIRTPSSFNFVIISAYNLYMVSMAAINWTIEYRKQNKKDTSITAK